MRLPKLADGDYETENSIDRRISAAVLAMAKPLRNDIQALKKQAADLEHQVIEATRIAREAVSALEALSKEIAELKQ